jgi:hypothetical protein
VSVLLAGTLLLALAAPPKASRVTLSEASLHLGRNQAARLALKLVGAKPITWMGFEAHEGRLVAAVKLGRKAWVETDIGDLIDEPTMSFIDDPWDIAFADYNHDGRLDFNVGKQCGSNNWCYWLFTIDPTGRVGLLPLPGAGNRPGFLWLGDDMYSTSRIELTTDGIAFSGYDPAQGGFRVRLRWDREARAFVRVDESLGSAQAGDKDHVP